jgi:hypothetical protein
MFERLWATVTTAEHCRVLPQCDDVGCQNFLVTGLKCRTAKFRGNRISWKVRIVKSRFRSEGSTGATGQEGTIQRAVVAKLRFGLRSAQPRRRVWQRPFGSSMGADLLWNFCLTLHLILTILFKCAKRMTSQQYSDRCMTWKSAYQLMNLHQIIDTAIRAVDDNQVEKIFRI